MALSLISLRHATRPNTIPAVAIAIERDEKAERWLEIVSDARNFR